MGKEDTGTCLWECVIVRTNNAQGVHKELIITTQQGYSTSNMSLSKWGPEEIGVKTDGGTFPMGPLLPHLGKINFTKLAGGLIQA